MLARSRSVLVVLAIALGIAGFTAVLAAYGILIRELNRGYLATNPASFTVFLERPDDSLLAAIRANPQVAGAEPRNVVSGRIKSGPAEWRNLVLFAVQDFSQIRIGKLAPEHGAPPPGLGQIWIERDAFQVAHAHVGDTVQVKTAHGPERSFKVIGGVHDVGQAQARMENLVYGYVTLATLAQLGEEPFPDRINVLAARDRFNESHLRAVAAEVQGLIESRGFKVRRIDIPTPGKHPHADIMGLLLLAMAAFGLCILGLSGILTVNLITALMASQIRQIGVMKTIGGTRLRIARIYLSQALLLGAAALPIAVPAGVWGGWRLCSYLAVFLNFDIASFAVPLWVFLLVALAGLATPVLAAAYPVWNGCGISVREALTDFGTSSDTFGTDPFERALAGLGGPFRPMLLAIRNSFRQRSRLMLTVTTLATGGLFFLCALNVRSSLVHTLDRLFAARKYDLSLSLAAMYPFEKIEQAVRKTPGFASAEGWIYADAESGGHFAMLAIPVDTKLLALQIVEGRGLQPGDTGAILINTALAAKNPRMRVGNTVKVRAGSSELPWRVVGIVREPFSPATGYVSKASGMTNSVRLVLDHPGDPSVNTVRANLDRHLEEAGVETLGSSSMAETRYGFDQHMLMIYVFLIVVSVIIGAVGGLGLTTTLSLNVLERRRELGVLRAIGARPAAIWLIVAGEGLATSLLGWLLAAVTAWPVSWALGNIISKGLLKSGLDFRFEPAGVGIWLAVSVFLGIGASVLPAWQASRLTVREALAQIS